VQTLSYLKFFVAQLRGVVQGIIDDPAICQIAKVRNDDAMAIGIVMEYIPGGTLKDFLIAAGKNKEQHPIFNVQMSLHLCLQIAEGLQVLHSHSIIHGDLKPENILLTKHLTDEQSDSLDPSEIVIRLADFGLSHVEENASTSKNKNNVSSSTAVKTASTISTTTHNSNTNHNNTNNNNNNYYHHRRNGFTLIYAAPELLEEKESSSFQPVYPTKASDLYALAIIIWEILSRKQPFPGKNQAELKSLLLKGIRPDLTLLPKGIPRMLQSLLKNLWNSDVTKRPEINSCCDLLKKCVELCKSSQPVSNDGESEDNKSDDDCIEEIVLPPPKQEPRDKIFQVIIFCLHFISLIFLAHFITFNYFPILLFLV
jgi:serine/threonine protein kinase